MEEQYGTVFLSNGLVAGVPIKAYESGDYKLPAQPVFSKRSNMRFQAPPGTWFVASNVPSDDGRVTVARLLALSKSKTDVMTDVERKVVVELDKVCGLTIDVVERVEDAEDDTPCYHMYGVVCPKQLIGVTLDRIIADPIKALRNCFVAPHYDDDRLSADQALYAVKRLSKKQIAKLWKSELPLDMARNRMADNYVDSIEYLIQNGPEGCLNIMDKDGFTILHNAAMSRSGANLIALLKQYGADLTAETNVGFTAVTLASANNFCLQNLKTLHEFGASLTYTPAPCNRPCCKDTAPALSPLHTALLHEATECAEFILESGEITEISQTCLNLARSPGNKAVVGKVEHAYLTLSPGLTSDLLATPTLISYMDDEQLRKRRDGQVRASQEASSSSSSSTSKRGAKRRLLVDDPATASSKDKKSSKKQRHQKVVLHAPTQKRFPLWENDGSSCRRNSCK